MRHSTNACRDGATAGVFAGHSSRRQADYTWSSLAREVPFPVPKITVSSTGGSMSGQSRRSPLVPLARIATLVAMGDLMTKQVALLWVGTLEPRVSSAIRFGVVHNDKGAF